jgi:hypothetical protein
LCSMSRSMSVAPMKPAPPVMKMRLFVIMLSRVILSEAKDPLRASRQGILRFAQDDTSPVHSASM